MVSRGQTQRVWSRRGMPHAAATQLVPYGGPGSLPLLAHPASVVACAAIHVEESRSVEIFYSGRHKILLSKAIGRADLRVIPFAIIDLAVARSGLARALLSVRRR